MSQKLRPRKKIKHNKAREEASTPSIGPSGKMKGIQSNVGAEELAWSVEARFLQLSVALEDYASPPPCWAVVARMSHAARAAAVVVDLWRPAAILLLFLPPLPRAPVLRRSLPLLTFGRPSARSSPWKSEVKRINSDPAEAVASTCELSPFL